MSQCATVTVTIRNRLGMHARPAMSFVDVASGFESSVTVKRADEAGDAVDGKSIMQIMMLAATRGTQLVITADGADAEPAIAALKKLVDGGFGED